MNVSKVILILLALVLLVVIFFALTGIDVRKPWEAMYILVDKAILINRAMTRALNELIFTIGAWFREIFAR